MSRYVDLEPAGDPVGLCVVLPGRQYPPGRPLLEVAANVAVRHGWRVRQVFWEYTQQSSGDTAAWAGQELAAAVGSHGGPVLVVGKSLGCYAAGAASAAGYDAIWLTPVLTDPLVAETLGRPGGRQLVVGGTGDSMWSTACARRLPQEVVEIDGADHALQVESDDARTAAILQELGDQVGAWLTSPRGRPGPRRRGARPACPTP